MEILSVFDSVFAPYGRVVQGLECSPVLECLQATTEKPMDGVRYVPSHAPLEALPTFDVLRDSVYGGMPIQIGYCNGTNTKLNCVEYHRDSEINIVADDIVLLVGMQCDIKEGSLETGTIRAFRVPANTAVELYATTLHYAPCNAALGAGFRVAVVLPRGTNAERPALPSPGRMEDVLLWARNKWLIAHAESDEARQGAFVGLTGENIDIALMI